MIEPTEQIFIKSQQSLINLLQDYSDELDTRKGSAIRQLLIRPYAYLYSKVNTFISNWIHQTSLNTLSQSLQTNNSVADDIASNYFVYRKTGIQAKGTLTLNCSQAQIRVPKGTLFEVDGYNFITQKTCIATVSPLADSQQINYTKMYRIQNKYKTNIPIVAQDIEYVEIPQGVQCSSLSYIAGVQSAVVTSPITGGAQAQTDASMIQRCKQRCGVSTGTLAAVRLKLSQLSIPVLGSNVIGSNQAGSFRSRYNNIGIPSGNSVDIFVKTNNQPAIKTIQLEQTDILLQNQKYTLYLDQKIDEDLVGALRLLSIVPQNQIQLGQYTIQYISGNQNTSGQGARLSEDQQIKVTFDTLTQPVPLIVSFQYTPGLGNIINDMKEQDNCLIGIDYKVKSAVPVRIQIQAQLASNTQLSSQQITYIKQDICSYINSKQVGQTKLNMDVLAQSIQYKYPFIKLRLPYTISVSMPMTNGANYTFNTTDGILDLNYRQSLYHWQTQIYFLSITPTDVFLEIV